MGRGTIVDDGRQILIFSIGDNQYAMDILHLREVGRMPRIEREPGAPDLVAGVVRMHGKPVRVYDLAQILEGEEVGHRPEIDRPWLIVSQEPNGEHHWMVDSVRDIVEYQPEQVSYEKRRTPEGTMESVAGVLELEGKLTYVLTPELLSSRKVAMSSQELSGSGPAVSPG